jgi:hypothetical protein
MLWEVAVPRMKSQFSHSHKPKVSGGAGKWQLCPALTRLRGASRGYNRICIGGTQGGAHGERRRGGIKNEATPVWGRRVREHAIGSSRTAGRKDGAPRNRERLGRR